MKESFAASAKALPIKPKQPDKPWVNEEVKKLSEEKAKYHLKIQTHKQNGQCIPQDLLSLYKSIKTQTKKVCKAALGHWWKQKAEEAEKTTQQSIKQGRGGSILRMLKLSINTKKNLDEFEE